MCDQLESQGKLAKRMDYNWLRPPGPFSQDGRRDLSGSLTSRDLPEGRKDSSSCLGNTQLAMAASGCGFKATILVPEVPGT